MPQNAVCFIILCYLNNAFLINRVLEFKYYHGCVKVETSGTNSLVTGSDPRGPEFSS